MIVAHRPIRKIASGGLEHAVRLSDRADESREGRACRSQRGCKARREMLLRQ
jgi:hypothetical protein